MKFFGSKLKKLPVLQEGAFHTRKIKKPTLKEFLIPGKMELSCTKLKKLLYFF